MTTRSLFALTLCLVTACTGSGAPAQVAPKLEDKPTTAAPAEPAEPALPDAEKLLAESVEAMGGADKFAGLKSFYAESTLNMGAL
ncbi:MAG TPA: hypothetical protein VGB85_02655, partial [Nannocystis sp.]